MLKLTVAVLVVALAGTASAAKWRDLRVDASSEDAFAQSLAEFKEVLRPAQLYVFGEALKDIWIQGEQVAEAERRAYTADEYYRQIDGLAYEQVVKYTDPTGDTAKRRYRSARRAMAEPMQSEQIQRLSAALAAAVALAPEARQRARAEGFVRYRAAQAARPTPKPTPTDRDRVLIAPPGFGPDSTAPFK